MIARAPLRLTDKLTVDQWTLRNAGGASVSVMGLGATLLAVEVPDRRGDLGNVAFGPAQLSTHVTGRHFMGPVVGRFANRIAGGGFMLDGQRFALPVNDGPNTLHGGPEGFDRRIWQGAEVETEDGRGLRLSLRSQDGDQGFPGQIDIAITYVWTDDFRLITDFRARSDRPTPFNPVLHAYWNLSGAAGGLGDHLLSLAASHYLPVDSGGIPHGFLCPVEATRFDLRRPRNLSGFLPAPGEDPHSESGLDQCWAIDGTGLRRAAVLTHPATGRVLTITTDQLGIQVYTANHFPLRAGHNEDPALVRHCAVALETQRFPDSPNQPGFPSAILRPGEEWRSRTIYAFTVESDALEQPGTR